MCVTTVFIILTNVFIVVTNVFIRVTNLFIRVTYLSFSAGRPQCGDQIMVILKNILTEVCDADKLIKCVKYSISH